MTTHDSAGAPADELTECERDIIDVLRAAGRRLTRDELCDALERANKVHSLPSVKRALSKLIEAGTINSRRQKPFGYALADASTAEHQHLDGAVTAAVLRHLTAAFEQLIAAGHQFARVTASTAELVFTLDARPATAPPERDAGTLDADAVQELSDCERDILAVLRADGRRMTGAQIRQALDAGNMLHGDSTVQKALTRLVATGILQANHSKPYGYVISRDPEPQE